MKKYNLFNLSITIKITLAALFLALAVILQKVAAVNYIPVVPFLRISFGGPAIIILASILLGPLFGAVVGAGSDLIGYLIFDPKNNAFFPQITLIYFLLGLLPYFLFVLIKKIRSKKVMFIIENCAISALLIFVSLYLFLNKDIALFSKTYTLEVWQKCLISGVAFILFVGIVIFTYLFDKKVEKEGTNSPLNIFQLSFGLLIIEIIVMVIFGSIMKACAFGFATYVAILITQIIVLFINIPLNTILISVFLKILTKNKPNVLND
jgi:ECF transporter S component (folate family)